MDQIGKMDEESMCSRYKRSHNSIECSVIVPVYNEEHNLEILASSIEHELDRFGISYEIIIVDDGSVDDTPKVLDTLSSHIAHLCIVRLSDNYGQQNAISAGLSVAVGQTIVTMDGDLQQDPRDIVTLLNRKIAGDVLYSGIRMNRNDSLLLRKFPSKVFNYILSLCIGYRVIDVGCSLKMFPRRFIDQMRDSNGICRYNIGKLYRIAKRFELCPVKHRTRHSGESKWRIVHLFSYAPELLIEVSSGWRRFILCSILVLINPLSILLYSVMGISIGEWTLEHLYCFGVFYILFSVLTLPFWWGCIKLWTRRHLPVYDISVIRSSEVVSETGGRKKAEREEACEFQKC